MKQTFWITLFFLIGLLKTENILGQKKNIVFLFADDAGYHDFGFQGSKTFTTPNLDQLAKEGVTFKQAYTTAAVCGPSRAGLLTGKYQQRFGFEENNVPGYMSKNSRDIGDQMGLPLKEKTIADHLKKLGYKSIVLGKWHMGNEDRYHPLNRGFDEFYGFRGGARSFFPLTQKQAFAKPEQRLEIGFGNYQEPKEYLTYDLANVACDFIEKNHKKPFFMYLSFNAVHSPLNATPEDLAKVKGLTGKRKKLAAMNIALDKACGMVIDKLKSLGIDKNTLIVFANDNGGPDGTHTSNYPLSGCKSNHLEGGIRVPFVMRLPNVIKEGSTYDQSVSMLDLLPTFVNVAGGNAKNLKDIDGVDLIPFVTKKKKEVPHEYLYWKKENRGAIRHGDWKLLRYPDRPAELYNIKKDIRERNNLASKNPEKVKTLFKKLFEWESTHERPMFMLKRVYETNAMERMDIKRDPVMTGL